tara:strand:- start:301 stop:666 length:366 start_codon:yes stop_codon:yes gene_type:complete
MSKTQHEDKLNIDTLICDEYTCGVYKLYNHNCDLIYIGKSDKLKGRILKSSSDKDALYFSFIITPTLSDMHLLEVYLISTLKPEMNKQFKESDNLTLSFPNILGFHKDSLMYDIKELKGEK